MSHNGRRFVQNLKHHGCQRIFTVPGESFLAVLDGLYDEHDIQTIICRQEGGAAMMAAAHARLTQNVGVCFVTRGPGATNASIGVHIALQDSLPLILFVGLPPTHFAQREAFQHIDIISTFSSMAKWAAVIAHADDIPATLSRAFHLAQSGRPGPIVIGLPENVLSSIAGEMGAVDNEGKSDAHKYANEQIAATPVPVPSPSAQDVDLVYHALQKAQRPLMLIGGPGWNSEVSAQVAHFAESWSLPVMTAFRSQDYIDNRHSHYIGDMGIGINPNLAKRIEQADLIIALGVRLGEMTTSGYSLLTPPTPKQQLIHIHPSADELGKVYSGATLIQSGSAAMMAALCALAPPSQRADDWRRAAKQDYEAFIRPEETPGELKMEQVIKLMSDMLPQDAILTNGAGNYTAWLHRYFQYKSFGTQLANRAGAMGFGLPAAIAAKLEHPDRTVIALAGDGCLMMTAQELATAAHYGLAIIVLVVNNGMYGTIRMHQEKHYPGRVLGTSLTNPDFAQFVQSFGGFGQRVERTHDFRAAFKAALASQTLSLIDLSVSPNAITPRFTLSELAKKPL